MKLLNKLLSFPFLGLIKIYQLFISPLLGNSKCRYTPTCSEYSAEAFKKYNVLKALYLTTKRILSCNPWGGSGYDPLR
jgi:uncharacterized protein